MYLSEEAEEELLFWADLEPNRSLPISVPKATQSLATDALTMGLGSYLKGELYSEPIPRATSITPSWSLWMGP